MTINKKTYLVWEGVENVESQLKMSFSEFEKKMEDNSILNFIPKGVKWIGLQKVIRYSDGTHKTFLIEKRFK